MSKTNEIKKTTKTYSVYSDEEAKALLDSLNWDKDGGDYESLHDFLEYCRLHELEVLVTEIRYKGKKFESVALTCEVAFEEF